MPEDDSTREQQPDRRDGAAAAIPLGMLFGLPAGLVLGFSVFDNIGIGLVMGLSIGVVAGIAFASSGKDRS